MTRRKRVISIRLSDEEYDQLQRLCVLRGIENISELARAGMKLLASHENGAAKDNIESRIHEIDLRVTTLDREIARLSNLMGVDRLEHQAPDSQADITDHQHA